MYLFVSVGDFARKVKCVGVWFLVSYCVCTVNVCVFVSLGNCACKVKCVCVGFSVKCV